MERQQRTAKEIRQKLLADLLCLQGTVREIREYAENLSKLKDTLPNNEEQKAMAE